MPPHPLTATEHFFARSNALEGSDSGPLGWAGARTAEATLDEETVADG